MKSLLMVILAVMIMISAGIVSAEEMDSATTAEEANASEEAVSLALSGEVAIVSSYVGQMSGTILWKEPAVQPCITLSYGELYIYGWGSFARDFDENYGTEIDIAAGYSKELFGWTVNGEYAYYGCSKLGRADDDIHSFHLNVDAPEIFGVVPFGKLEADVPVDGSEGGWFWGAGLRHSQEVFQQPIDIELFFGGHDGAFGVRPELMSFGRATIATTFQIGKVSITPSVFYQLRTHADGMADDALVGILKLGI